MSTAWFVNPKRRGSKGRRHKSRRRSKAKRRHNFPPVATKKRRKSRRRSKSGAMGFLRKHHARRRMSNPIGGSVDTVKRAAIGAGGALALDLLFGVVPMPAMLQAGPVQYLTKGAIALGVGLAGKHFGKSKAVEQAAEGALTVILHEAGRAGIRQYFPNVDARMGEFYPLDGYASPAQIVGDRSELDAGYFDDGMGGFIPLDGLDDMVDGEFDSPEDHAFAGVGY